MLSTSADVGCWETTSEQNARVSHYRMGRIAGDSLAGCGAARQIIASPRIQQIAGDKLQPIYERFFCLRGNSSVDASAAHTDARTVRERRDSCHQLLFLTR